jgi:hypothetical protein
MTTKLVVASVYLQRYFTKENLIFPHELELTGHVASGANGSVDKYLFKHEEVAVKRFTYRNLTKKVLQKFIKEIDIFSRPEIKHPNICAFKGALSPPSLSLSPPLPPFLPSSPPPLSSPPPSTPPPLLSPLLPSPLLSSITFTAPSTPHSLSLLPFLPPPISLIKGVLVDPPHLAIVMELCDSCDMFEVCVAAMLLLNAAAVLLLNAAAMLCCCSMLLLCCL